MRVMVALSFGVWLAACTPFSRKMDSWIGHPVQQWLDIPDKGGERLEEIRGPDRLGNRVYVISIERNCHVFWTVDAQGIMRSWQSEGAACKYYTN
jgi:ABC-type uncharacterized transport system permease subunit